jgi:hypothetical protein
MEATEDVSNWRVKELRDWLEGRSINYSKSAKKQELIDLVNEAQKSGERAERPAETDPTKMKVTGRVTFELQSLNNLLKGG